MNETFSQTLISVAHGYLKQITSTSIPNLSLLASELLGKIHEAIDAHNIASSKDERWKKPPDLPLFIIAEVLMYFFIFKCIHWIEGELSRDYLGIYQSSGELEGLYTDDSQYLCDAVYQLYPGASPEEIKTITETIKRKAPLVMPCENPDYVPLKNGIYNYKTKKLMPFSPDIVLTKKSPIKFNQYAKDVSITMPDGEIFTLEGFIESLTDDVEVRQLLYEIAGACLRPYHNWGKTVIPMNAKGNNGKGSYCHMLEQMLGSTTQLSFAQFGNPVYLESLITANAVICHENSVKNFNTNAEAIKSCITGDKILVNRKYKKPITLRFKGMIIECCNDLPKFQDTSASWYRRLLPIPFDKCFTGCERKYIKEDYLKRTEVLEYLVKKVLVDIPDYYELSEPEACRKLLNKYMQFNDTTRQFISDVITDNEELAWSFYPWEFLYKCYINWLKQKCPEGKALSDSQFRESITNVLVNCYDAEWELHRGHISAEQKNTWEPLISEYHLYEFEQRSNSGAYSYNLPYFSKNDYRGIARCKK